jgi:DNA-binding Xre family transcriptional regulator
MKLTFRLKEILEERRLNRRGIIKEITSRTSLERHQVAALLKNKVNYLSLDTLSQICDYLARYHGVDASLLPGILFGKEPSDFWDMLAQRGYLELCIGVRSSEGEASWVTDSDAYLQGRLLNSISGSGFQARLTAQFLEQRLVPAPDPDTGTPDHGAAQSVYREFKKGGGNRALVAIGSVKIDIISEMIAADCFRAKPFEAQDDVSRPQERKCPFMFLYRADDPKPPSCCGGVRLARARPAAEPGIYYEDADGKWQSCPWSPTRDSAVILYVYRPPVERLEVVLGGFSGRATRGLALVLQTHERSLWPPCYDATDLKVGAFVVQFQFDSRTGMESHIAPTDVKIIPLAPEVLRRRLEV